jgi:hypothetical protein
MKCIRNIKTNEVTRVSNERAEEAIKKGGFVFVQKIEWKQSIGTTWNKNNVPANPMSNKKIANKAARYMTPPKANSRRSKERGNR